MYKETTNKIINYNKIRTPSREPRVTVESPNNKPTKSDLLEHKTMTIKITNTETVNELTSAVCCNLMPDTITLSHSFLADLVYTYKLNSFKIKNTAYYCNWQDYSDP